MDRSKGLHKWHMILPFVILSILYLKNNIFQYALFALFLVPMFFYIVQRKTISLKYLYLIGFLVIQFLLSLVSSSISTSIKNSAQYILNIAPIILYDCSMKYLNEDDRFLCSKSFAKTSGIFFGYCLIASFIYAQTSIYALRNLATVTVATSGNSSLPLAIGGGYPLIFALVILSPFLLFIATKYPNKPLWKFGLIALVVFIEIFIVETNNTTSVLISLLGCLLVVLSGRKKDYTRWVIGLGGMVIIYLLTNPLILGNILDFIANLFDQNSIIRVRLSEIVPALYSSNTNSSFGLRLHGYQKSWNSFISHPIEGVGIHSGYDYMALADHLGWHCEWLDMLAEFGLILASFYIAFLFCSYRETYNSFKYTESKIIYRICGILFIFMGFLDPIMNGNMVLTLFLVIPSVLNVLEHKKTKGRLK